MQEHPILIGQYEDGRYMEFDGTEHVGVHARSGSGKTANFVMPNCFDWPGSLVVLDIKRQCWNATAGHRKERLGQDVFLFDPTARDGRSHRWNSLDMIDRTSPDRFDQIMRQSYGLFPESFGSSNAERFWEPAGRQAFNAVIALLCETPEEPLTLSNVLRVFMRGDYHTWLVDHIEARREAGNPYSMPVVEAVSDFLSGSEELVNSVRKTVSTTLQAFWNPRITAATSGSDFDLRMLRKRPTTIYVAIAPAHIPRMRPLLRLLFDQLINFNTDVTPEEDSSLTVPGLLVLDEFVRLGKATTLAEAAQFVRGYGWRVAYVIQDKDQLNHLYGEAGARDIFSNLGVEIVFGTGDIKLAQEIEKQLGDDTQWVDTTNKPKYMSALQWSKQSQSTHPHRRAVLWAHEILQMPPDLQIVLRPGMKPVQSNRIVWYKDPHFKGLVLPPPPVRPLSIMVPLDDGSIKLQVRRQAKEPPEVFPPLPSA
jgi:type IV secretion system protein VirD4